MFGDLGKMAGDLGAELRALRLLLSSSFGNVDADEPWYMDGTATLPAATAALTPIVTVPLLPRMAGVMDMLACELESGEWAEADGTGGVAFVVVVGDMPKPGLSLINGPWGFMGARQPVKPGVRFGPDAQLVIAGRNTHPTDDAAVCVQATGFYFPKLAPLVDGVGPRLAGGRRG